MTRPLLIALILLASLTDPYSAVGGPVEAKKPTEYHEGPCKAIHYGRPGYKREVSMEEVVWNRQYARSHIIKGFKPRGDVAGFMAVRNADQWRIAQNWRALVQFQLPNGTFSQPMWMQPSDYQKLSDEKKEKAWAKETGTKYYYCRSEISEKLANSMGWSLWQGWGKRESYIIRWER